MASLSLDDGDRGYESEVDRGLRGAGADVCDDAFWSWPDDTQGRVLGIGGAFALGLVVGAFLWALIVYALLFALS